MPKRHTYARTFNQSIVCFAEIHCEINGVVNFFANANCGSGFCAHRDEIPEL